jgi:hypothetical protein
MTDAALPPPTDLKDTMEEMRAAMAREGKNRGAAGALQAVLLKFLDLLIRMLTDFRAGKLAPPGAGRCSPVRGEGGVARDDRSSARQHAAERAPVSVSAGAAPRFAGSGALAAERHLTPAPGSSPGQALSAERRGRRAADRRALEPSRASAGEQGDPALPRVRAPWFSPSSAGAAGGCIEAPGKR